MFYFMYILFKIDYIDNVVSIIVKLQTLTYHLYKLRRDGKPVFRSYWTLISAVQCSVSQLNVLCAVGTLYKLNVLCAVGTLYKLNVLCAVGTLYKLNVLCAVGTLYKLNVLCAVGTLYKLNVLCAVGTLYT